MSNMEHMLHKTSCLSSSTIWGVCSKLSRYRKHNSAVNHSQPETYNPFCGVDGSGFTRILQSLALMCSNKPGLPMMFGADHLHPPRALDPLTPLTSKASGNQEQQHSHVSDPGVGGAMVCQSARMNQLKADIDSRDQHILTQVHL